MRAKSSPKFILVKDTASEKDVRGKGQILDISIPDNCIKLIRKIECLIIFFSLLIKVCPYPPITTPLPFMTSPPRC